MENWQDYLNPELIQAYALQYGKVIFFSLLIFIIGKWVAARISRLSERAMGRAKLDATLIRFISNIVHAVLLVFVVIAALSQLGVETTSLAAVLAAAGLAIGLALQGSLSNFAAGVMIIAFRPFKAGDYVEAGGCAGSVEEVTVFHTVMKTPDNKKVIVPNSAITSGPITNYSAHDTRRIDLVFGIGYDDDIKTAKTVLETILQNDERVLKDPAPTIGVLELADSSVNLACRPWVRTADYWAVYWDVMEQVKQRFDEEGITIPYPQQSVYMHHIQADDSKAAA